MKLRLKLNLVGLSKQLFQGVLDGEGDLNPASARSYRAYSKWPVSFEDPALEHFPAAYEIADRLNRHHLVWRNCDVG